MKTRDTSFLLDRPIAHRGYHSKDSGIPENSILAFEKAIRNNCIIELDVHLLKDSNVVVFHDDNLKRMTGINKNLKECSYDELKEVYLNNTNQTIPLLKDVLELVNGRVPLIIELKYDVKLGLLESKVIELLDNYKGNYAIKSFNPFTVIYFRFKRPNVIRGQLLSEKFNSKIYGRHFFDFVSKPDFISCNFRDIKKFKFNRGKKKRIILGWTIRNIDDFNTAIKYCDNCICENFNLKKIK